MKLRIESERSFWFLALGIFALLAGVTYFPVFLGRIPFPQDMVLQFPAWYEFPRSGPLERYADIGDLVTSFYTFRAYASHAIQQGILPLWNPHILLGAPFLANSQSALFYPQHLLFYVLPLPIAWTASILISMFLAAIFMALLMRSIGSSKTGAILSGILFASCGFMTAWQGQAMYEAAIWLPLICYSVHRLHIKPSPALVALTSLAFAMPVLAGHPETAAHLTLAGMFMALILWLSPDTLGGRDFHFRFILAFTIAGALALGIASIQWIPTLEWLGQLGWALQPAWPTLPPHQSLALVSRDISRSPNSAGIPVPEGAAYVGMFTLLAAALAPFYKAKRYVVFFALLTLMAWGAAYSIEPIHWIANHTPLLKGLKNNRLILVASFGFAGLAGLGVSALEQEKNLLSIRKRAAMLYLGGALLVSFALVYTLQRQTEVRTDFLHRPSFSGALLFLSVIPIAWRLYGGLRGRAFPVIVCALAGFDLVTFGYGYTGFAPPKEIYPAAPVFDFLKTRTDPSPFRIAHIGGPYPSNSPMFYGIDSADGYDVLLYRPRTFSYLLSQDRLDGIVLNEASVMGFKDRRLDLMNVRYIVHSPYFQGFDRFAAQDRFSLVYKTADTAVFENKSVLPRAFAVPNQGIEVLQEIPSQVARLRDPSFDPERSVILADLPKSIASQDRGTPSLPVSSNVEITESGINEVALRADIQQPSILVLSQTYYPGWKAMVDGKEVDVFPANLAFTGIALSAGSHDVRLVFDPLSFRVGAALTTASTLILGGLFASGLRARRKRMQRDTAKAAAEDNAVKPRDR